MGKGLYMQTHVDDGDGGLTTMISELAYDATATGTFPLLWPTSNAAVFGYSGYQYANFETSVKKEL